MGLLRKLGPIDLIPNLNRLRETKHSNNIPAI